LFRLQNSFACCPLESMSATTASASGGYVSPAGQCAPMEVEEGAEFPLGALVRLEGLQDLRFNHHVGRVVPPHRAIANGRVSVALHGAIWPDLAGDSAAEASCGEHQQKRRLRPLKKALHEPIALKTEKLRRIHWPLPSSCGDMTLLDSVSMTMGMRLLGESGWGLPENVAEQAMSHLRIRSVASSDISVSGYSSKRNDFPISAVLNSREDEWWVSASGLGSRTGTMGISGAGQGCEYLEFSFGPVARRISFLAMKIPPLPHGPLSVREFHLLALDDDGAWCPASPNPLITLDRGDLQEFALVPPVETVGMKLVCTRNAAADSENGMSIDCIGLFQVSFA